MAFEYVDLQDARTGDGVRMSVVSGIPSPWSEAAKGILHMKAIDWKAVRHSPGNRELQNWTGCHNAPALKFGSGPSRSGWAEILLFAEQHTARPNLLPQDVERRAQMFGLSHEFMGQDGLCWLRRLQLAHGAKQMQGPPRENADYIASKYGYRAEDIPRGHARVIDLLTLFSGILTSQKAKGSSYYLGNRATALDIYSAASMALFAPLPEQQCPMDPAIRIAFSMSDQATKVALSPILLSHRDMMYEKHLSLPLSL